MKVNGFSCLSALAMGFALPAIFLCIVMILAIAEHLHYREVRKTLMNVVIIGISIFVAIGRFVPVPAN